MREEGCYGIITIVTKKILMKNVQHIVIALVAHITLLLPCHGLSPNNKINVLN